MNFLHRIFNFKIYCLGVLEERRLGECQNSTRCICIYIHVYILLGPVRICGMRPAAFRCLWCVCDCTYIRTYALPPATHAHCVRAYVRLPVTFVAALV